MDASSWSGTSMLWRRLDPPGHDAARLVEEASNSRLLGMAVFRDEGGSTALHYRVSCDAAWQPTEAHIEGWRGTRPIELLIRRDAIGRWSVNDDPCPAVVGCTDLDLSFTPATNLLPLRRLNLAVGHMAEVRSAWLEWPASTLRPLVQRYVRESAATYGYEADLPNRGRFTGLLRVDSVGWVLDYPGLWHAEGGA